MKKFAFNHEVLLNYRKNLEEKERIDLAQLYFRLQTELNRRQELLTRQRDTLAELAQRQCDNEDHQEVTWFYLYLKRLQDEIQARSRQIVQLEQAIDSQRDVVIQSSKNKKVLDTLKSKQKKAFIWNDDKREQKGMDDLVITQFAREKFEKAPG